MSDSDTPRKVGKVEYRKFRETFLKWQVLLGLTEYEIGFVRSSDPSAIASINANPKGCTAEVSYCEVSLDEPEPEATALHEALHLLLARLMWMAEERYICEAALWQENERIVRVLERLLR